MSKNTWDAVLASTPLNATAAAVTGQGVSFTPEEMPSGHIWDEMPALRNLNKVTTLGAGFIDLRGREFGRLLVIGLLDSGQSSSGIWVCRCKCGRYCGFRSKTLKNASRDRCDHCDYTQKLALFASGDKARKRAADTTKRRWTLP